MKTTTIITITAACLASITMSSCSLDPEYREWKKKNKGADATANPYGAPAAATTNPYGVPQTSGEAGAYTPAAPAAGGNAPYQPLPGVNQPATPTAPEVAPPVAGTPAVGGTSHTVVSGDSLWGLARKYGTTIEAIQAANGLTSTNIRTGQQLTIPGR
ncbi:MAG: LysM peptidoglycan-binding domain-containing protein [Verrucomicrobiae bacterium]|nr:LysM peptidoglycan-binding domain-containing protein [Verrucomicrobiae bacterium]NNJ86159.1 LysM peptidoglycan-binding domain-containing protein [Akkermansiaceae bacterium]